MIKTYFILLLLTLGLLSCNDPKSNVDKAPEKLVETRNGIFTEWYPGKKNIKFTGALNKKGNREGKWVFYSEKGLELSLTQFEDGKKVGFSIVKYPSGVVHYRGEYRNDQMIGIWSTYDEKGELASEKDYGLGDE